MQNFEARNSTIFTFVNFNAFDALFKDSLRLYSSDVITNQPHMKAFEDDYFIIADSSKLQEGVSGAVIKSFNIQEVPSSGSFIIHMKAFS